MSESFTIALGEIEVGGRRGRATGFDFGRAKRAEKEGISRRWRFGNEEEEQRRRTSERGGESFVEVRVELRRGREEG